MISKPVNQSSVSLFIIIHKNQDKVTLPGSFFIKYIALQKSIQPLCFIFLKYLVNFNGPVHSFLITYESKKNSSVICIILV
jgi:hypothetical protein